MKDKKPIEKKVSEKKIIDRKMKDRSFIVKIADLLNETWKEDQIVFEHKLSDQLPQLDADGVSATFSVQSLNSSSLLGTLSDITCRINDVCDSCGVAFTRDVAIPSYVARFVLSGDVTEKEKNESEEAILLIDPKSETINIEDMVVQAILLNEPFVKRCDACTKRLDKEDDEDDSPEYFETKSNIVFS